MSMEASDSAVLMGAGVSNDTMVALDHAYLLIMSIVVLLMQPGFTLLEVGTTHLENSASILLKNFTDVFYSSITFFFVGHRLAFSINKNYNNTFIGIGSDDILQAKDSLFFFQLAFASTCATIVSGAMIERTRHVSYIFSTIVLMSVVYPVTVHWVWSDTGWLSFSNMDPVLGRPLLDFAGSGVVHLVGGTTAFVGAYMVGPRQKRGQCGHSVSFAGLGTMILWVGFYGFNCGSTYGVTNGKFQIASLVAINTTLSACASGSIAHIILLYTGGNQLKIGDVLNCTLTGLVSISASCNALNPLLAIVVGLGAMIVYRVASTLSLYLGIDDPLNAFAVHAGGGVWGLISAGLFANDQASSISSLFHGDVTQLGVQLLGSLVIIAWSGITSLITFFVIDRTIGLRESLKAEVEGLDKQIAVAQSTELLELKAALMQSQGLEDLIEHPDEPLLMKFREFLRAEYAAENLDFLIAIVKFRSQVHESMSLMAGSMMISSTRDSRLFQEAKNIFDKYVSAHSMYEVKLSYSIRAEFQRLIEVQGSVAFVMQALSRAYMEILSTVKEDAWRRFLSQFTSRNQSQQRKTGNLSLCHSMPVTTALRPSLITPSSVVVSSDSQEETSTPKHYSQTRHLHTVKMP